PDAVLERDGRGRLLGGSGAHQVPRRRPVGMAIQQRPEDPAVDDAGERLVIRAWLPLGNEHGSIVGVGPAADMQPARVRRSAAEAPPSRRVALLQARTGYLGHRREYRSRT